MPIRIAEAHWNGGFRYGRGTMEIGNGGLDGHYSADARFDDDSGNNPEELIGAAHAGCFSMALSLLLEQAGYTPEVIDTRAAVHLNAQNGGYRISRIELSTWARIPQIDQHEFDNLAQRAKTDCPVSQALAGTEITLKAELRS
jgi:osmotically inducible protein OsmC